MCRFILVLHQEKLVFLPQINISWHWYPALTFILICPSWWFTFTCSLIRKLSGAILCSWYEKLSDMKTFRSRSCWTAQWSAASRRGRWRQLPETNSTTSRSRSLETRTRTSLRWSYCNLFYTAVFQIKPQFWTPTFTPIFTATLTFTFNGQAEESSMTGTWFRALQYYSQCLGGWRRRRRGLPNIMVDPGVVWSG